MRAWLLLLSFVSVALLTSLALAGLLRDEPLVEPTELPVPGASWTRINQPSGTLIAPAQHLDAQGRLDFYSGLSFFKQPWVQAPASTTARDGLGPIFNANACISCHSNGGRSRSLLHDPSTTTAIARLSVRSRERQWQPHPRYGSQLQTRAITGVLPEGQVQASYRPQSVLVAGRRYEKRYPDVSVALASSDTAADSELLVSLRVAPSLIGMGLLEAVPEERLRQLADPQDRNGDAVSGRIHWVNDRFLGRAPGRFGWKALHATVASQTGAAFRDDVGITNRYFPESPCGDVQTVCLAAPDGNDPQQGVEIADMLFNLVVHFTANIPPPASGRRSDQVVQGQRLFTEVGCAGCHTPSHETQYGEIWPYTDLLLHDLGPELSDGRPEGDAQGHEWRTAPLWGLGTQKRVSGHTELLHDGRAKNLVEAVLWHGGEAAAVRKRFLSLSPQDIDAIRAFVRAI